MIADGRAHDVHDGINSPDFVEMHLVHRLAVDLGLGLGHLAEDGQARVLDRLV